MQTVADIVDAFGGPTAFAKVIERGVSTASEMKRRGSIHGRYWEAVVRAARARGIDGVTLEGLARFHARPRGTPARQAGQHRSGQDRER
jgi:hypothetical protein